MTAADLRGNPDLVTRSLRASDCTPFTGRLLRAGDAVALGRYFDGLSAATRRVYGPHPLNADCARQLCAEIDFGRALRFLAVLDPEDLRWQGATVAAAPPDGPEPVAVRRREGACESPRESVVVGYFILELGVRAGDGERFGLHGIPLTADQTCTFAPSVGDAFQGRGLGSALMPLVLETARQLSRRRVILMGGVRADNPRARHFYAKFGFRPVGDFEAGGVDNCDMVLEL